MFSTLVLLIDDNAVESEVLRSFLQAKGWLSVSADGVNVASDDGVPGQRGLVVVVPSQDAQMRRCSLLEKLERPTSSIPLIAVVDSEPEALAAGAEKFIIRPFRLEQLSVLLDDIAAGNNGRSSGATL